MKISRYLPSPEALNLFVGIISATAINVLTSVALGSVARQSVRGAITCGCLMLAGAVAGGVLANWTTAARDDALNGVPFSISSRERRALIRNSIDALGPRVPFVASVSIVCLTGSLLSVALLW